MIDSLISHIIACTEHGDTFVRIERIAWTGSDVVLELSVTDYDGGPTHSEWAVKCRAVRECVIIGRFGDLAVHEDGHPAIRQHRDPARALFFNGRVADVDALIGRLWTRHQQLAGNWIEFERYLNTQRPMRDLLSFGFGKLADGPDFLIQGYAGVLMEASVQVSLGNLWPARVWTGSAWIETAADLSMLSVDTSFVVAEAFEEERRGVRQP